MEINQAICNSCGQCITECPKRAILHTKDNEYIIDQNLCNDCVDIYEKQCVAVCPLSAIGSRTADGRLKMELFDPTPRVRPHILLFIVAMLHGRGASSFSKKDRRNLGPLIGAAYRDPDFKFRVVMNFDDNCRLCPKKCLEGHAEEMGDLDRKVMDKIGLEAGKKIRLWDAVKLVEDHMSIDLLRNHLDLKEETVEFILSGMPPQAPIWTNS